MDRLRLHLGDADPAPTGFTSVGLQPGADVPADLTLGLPFADGSVEVICCQGVLEHLSQAQGVALLRECRRVLGAGGILRVSTVDLEAVLEAYAQAGPQSPGVGPAAPHAEVLPPGVEHAASPGEMVNLAMRHGGRSWLYDEAELRRLAEMAGLSPLGRRPPGHSDVAELRDLEGETGGRLVVEFERPRPPARRGEALVSLLIAAYTPDYLEACLRSAVTQTYRHLEIVVNDDRPGDDAVRRIVERFAGDPRLRYERNPQNLGNLDNYLACYRRARGDYIKFLNDDDLLYPTCLESQVQALEAYPEVTLTTSHRQVIDARGATLPDTVHTRVPLTRTSIVDGTYAAWLITNVAVNFIGEPSTVLFRRRDVDHVRPHLFTFGGRNPGAVGDVTCWLNLLSRGDLHYDVRTLSAFRQHDAQLSHPREDVVRRHQRAWQILRQDAERLGFYQRRDLHRPLVRPAPASTADADPLLRVRGLIAQERWDEAISGLEAFVEDHGHSAESALLLGDIMRQRTSVDKARQVWQEGLQSGGRPLDLELLARLHQETSGTA